MSASPTAQAELEHAAGPNWRQPFVPPVKEEEVKTEEGKPEVKTEEVEAEEEKKPEVKAEPKKDEDEKPGRWSKRVDTLTKRLHALEDQLAEKDRELRLRGEVPKAEEKKSPPKADPNEPKEEDFTGPTAFKDYMKALGRYEAKKENEETRAREQAEAARAEQQESFDRYNEGVAKLRADIEDFDEVLDSLKNNSPISQTMQVSIIEADNGPEIVYYLAKHPEIREQIYALSSGRQAVEIGRLSLYLEGEKGTPQEEVKSEVKAEPEQKKPAVTVKPKPITPVGSKVASTVDLSKVPYQDYKVARRAQRRGIQ